ncbi:MAG: 4-hydroxythreonine-4-phosphate dehydrogenase PdxA [Ignavibacteriales bacterium]|nr:4-hydroxythreonine-4-phosphate dehydrogenase PdxA [Ignavibacteriales bacterium]
MKPRIAITIGDFNGIGPEVVLKCLANAPLMKTIDPILIGSPEVFAFYATKFKIRKKLSLVQSATQKPAAGTIPVLQVFTATAKNVQPGILAPDAGVCSGRAIEQAVRLCLDGSVDAMVTAPVSKEALRVAGYNFPGQTEMLAMLSRSARVMMMFVSETMTVGLATIHLPLRAVPDSITIDRIVEKLEILHGALVNDLKKKSPTIAVLGLNPHAGENGMMGTEEKEIIGPALQKSAAQGIIAEGPFAADAFFGNARQKQFDGVLAMYHDQGLIPLKMEDFDNSVNYSAGLRIIRTSPDHGTAFDIAGKGTANPKSMAAAIRLAKTIVENRKKKV